MEEQSDVDRLSSLPDSLLYHILSFLPTKLSVATSVLATRYRFLWADVPKLDFHCDNHVMMPGGMSFSDIVSRVLMLSNVRNLNSFRLTLYYYKFSEVHQFESWIRTTIARNVQALEVALSFKTRNLQAPRIALSLDAYVPQCLFTSKTLVDLRLHSCGAPPGSIFLPNLKKLHLRNFYIRNDRELQDLISGCPVLEVLFLTLRSESVYKHRIISSPTIKWLTLKRDFNKVGNDFVANFSDHKLEVNTPAVRYLHLVDDDSQHILTGVFNSLVEAEIYLRNVEVQDGVLYFSSVLEFVEKLCQLKCLVLLVNYTEFLDSSLAVSTWKFVNLTKLEMHVDWRILLKFLESANNLEVLIIRKVHDTLNCWREPQKVPTCLTSHLRQVTMNSFGYSENEFQIISYILKNGKVLKMMDITSPTEVNTRDIDVKYMDLQIKFNVLQRISTFERESNTCKVEFS